MDESIKQFSIEHPYSHLFYKGIDIGPAGSTYLGRNNRYVYAFWRWPLLLTLTIALLLAGPIVGFTSTNGLQSHSATEGIVVNC